MTKRFIFQFVILLLGFGQIAGREYQPILEDGKEWIVGKYNTLGNYGLRSYQSLFWAKVIGDTVVLDQPCKVVSFSYSPTKSGTNYILHESDGVLYLYFKLNGSIGDVEEAFNPLIDMNAVDGQEFNCRSYNSNNVWSSAFSVDFTRSTSKQNDIERKEVCFSREAPEEVFPSIYYDNYYDYGDSWVEGIGASRFRMISINPINNTDRTYNFYYTVSCSKDGEKIFDHNDFYFSPSYGLHGAKTITPGKSWTVLKNGKVETISVDRDSVVCDVYCRILKSSDGEEYISTEDNGRIYILTTRTTVFGTYLSAMPILDFDLYRHKLRRMDSDTGLYFGSEADNTINAVEDLEVGDRIFDEYHVTKSCALPTGSNTTTWVKEVGAPCADWLTIFPSDFDLKLIDCRENGEVIFTYKDFSYPVWSGLDDISAVSPQNDIIYNLQGQRLQRPKRGINIINGKKVIN